MLPPWGRIPTIVTLAHVFWRVRNRRQSYPLPLKSSVMCHKKRKVFRALFVHGFYIEGQWRMLLKHGNPGKSPRSSNSLWIELSDATGSFGQRQTYRIGIHIV